MFPLVLLRHARLLLTRPGLEAKIFLDALKRLFAVRVEYGNLTSSSQRCHSLIEKDSFVNQIINRWWLFQKNKKKTKHQTERNFLSTILKVVTLWSPPHTFTAYTEILDQGWNKGPQISHVCFCLYLKHLCVSTHSKPALRIQILRYMMMTASHVCDFCLSNNILCSWIALNNFALSLQGEEVYDLVSPIHHDFSL